MREFSEGCFMLFMAGIVIVLASIPIIAGVAWMDSISCRQQAEAMYVAHRYKFPAGCLVRTANGSYVSLDGYRAVESTKLGRTQ